MTRIGVVTSQAYRDAAENALLQRALAARGARAEVVAWDDPAVAWPRYDRLALKSCWNYHLCAPAFLAWLDRLDVLRVPLVNATDVVRANLSKRYLKTLADAGVPVVPSAFLTEVPPAAPSAVPASWTRLVAKPAVSASAFRTLAFERARWAEHGEALGAIARHSELLVQPYLDAVETRGERSLVYISGAFTHAVEKRPARGDFRVQGELGGRSRLCRPGAATVALGRAALDALAPHAPYARVDVLPHDSGWCVGEVELIDPELFFALAPRALDALAEALLS